MRLNSFDTFRLPFGSKSLALRCLADRAVTLLAILPVIRVSVFAMRLLRVHVSKRSRVFARIFCDSQRFDVLWIHASTIPASMVCDHSGWDGATSKEHGNARSAPWRAAKGDGPVPISIFRSLPLVTVADSLPFGIKSLNLCFRRRVHLALLAMATTEQKGSAVLFGAQ